MGEVVVLLTTALHNLSNFSQLHNGIQGQRQLTRLAQNRSTHRSIDRHSYHVAATTTSIMSTPFIGSWAANAWSSTIDEAGQGGTWWASPYAILVLGTFMIHEAAWLLFNVPYMLLEASGWLSQYRIFKVLRHDLAGSKTTVHANVITDELGLCITILPTTGTNTKDELHGSTAGRDGEACCWPCRAGKQHTLKRQPAARHRPATWNLTNSLLVPLPHTQFVPMLVIAGKALLMIGFTTSAGTLPPWYSHVALHTPSYQPTSQPASQW